MARGKVVVGTAAGTVLAFPIACRQEPEATGCAPEWTATTGGSVSSTPAIAGELVYVGSDDGFIYGYLLACRPGVCNASWASGLRGPVSASPSVSDGAVYVASEDGTIHRWSLP